MSFGKDIRRFDEKAMEFLPRVRRKWLTPIMVALTYSGSGIVWFGCTILFIVLVKTNVRFVDEPVILLSAMLGAFFSLISGQVLKAVFRRPRPWKVIPNHVILIKKPLDSSMPSTHASTAFALAVGLSLQGHPLALFIWPWALMVIFSRYYLGVHFPSDLAAGSLWGLVFGIFHYERVVEWVLGIL